MTTPIVVAPGQSSGIIKEPGKYDILCGKDKTCLSHYGSKHFRGVIEVHRTRYEKASTKHEKMSITQEIVSTLNRTSSRFLKFNTTEQGWEEISHMAARDKVSHALRFANNRSRKAKDKIQRKTKPKNKSTVKKETVKKVSPPSALTVEAATTNATTTPANKTFINNDNCRDHALPEWRIQSPTTTTTTTTAEKKKGHVRKVSEDEDLFSEVASLLFSDPPQTALEPIDDESQNFSRGKRRGHHVRKVSDEDVFANITSQLFDQPQQTFDLNSSGEKKKRGHVRKVSNDDDDALIFDIDPSEFHYSFSHSGPSSPLVETAVDISPAVIAPNEGTRDCSPPATSHICPPYSRSIIVEDDSSDCSSDDSAAVVIENEHDSNNRTGPVNSPVSCTLSSSTAETTSTVDIQEEHSKNNECGSEYRKKDTPNTSNDLSWIMNEPLMEWDLATDTIFIL